jgi:thymidylate synthase ThyX
MLYSRPIVRLLSQTVRPFADVVSSARTCYSGKGIVLPSDVLDAVAQEPEANDRYHGILSSIYQAGHHTTFQHSYLHFAIENVSRQAIWSFLHSHTFYNSEQVSQRYVKVKKDQLFVPQGLNQAQLDCLQDCYEFQIKAYHEMGKMLAPVTEAEYLKRFKSRRGSKRAEKDIQKKCQEIARCTAAWNYSLSSSYSGILDRTSLHTVVSDAGCPNGTEDAGGGHAGKHSRIGS